MGLGWVICPQSFVGEVGREKYRGDGARCVNEDAAPVAFGVELTL